MPMSEEARTKNALCASVRQKALQRLSKVYPETFEQLLDIEREKVGLPPIKQKYAEST